MSSNQNQISSFELTNINTNEKSYPILNNDNIERLDNENNGEVSLDETKIDNSIKENKENKKRSIFFKKNNIKYGILDGYINQIGINKYTFSIMVIFSFLIMIDGGEMTVVSLLVTKLGSDWKLNDTQKGLMGAAVFIGFFLGTLISGKLSDIYGRRPLFLIGNFTICLFALLSAFSASFISFSIFRGFCGFGVGLSLPSSAAMATEVCPSKLRGILINLLAVFFPLGEIITALIAKQLMKNYDEGWRYVLGFIAIPMILVFLLSIMIRESPRFLANNHQFEEAFEEIELLLNRKILISDEDKKKIVDEVNIASENSKLNSNYLELFNKKYLHLCLSVSFLLFSCSVIYYGVIYILPQAIERNINSNNKSNSSIDENINDTIMTTEDLNEVFDGVIYSALSEIPAPLIALALVNIPSIGRKYGLAIGFGITSIFALFCLFFNDSIIVWASLLKFGINIPFSIGYLYVTEAFPTKIRSIAIGFTNSFTRIGGIITPLISQLLFEVKVALPYLFYLIFSVGSVFISVFLPVETYGRVLE